MPSLKMMLKIFSTIVIVAGLGLVVVSGPAPQFTWNPSGTGEFDPDASADWDLKDAMAPVHNEPNESGEPTQEEIDLKSAENLARTVGHLYPIDLKESPFHAPAQGGDKDADAVLFYEGFEDGTPPPTWTSVVNNPFTWEGNDYAPYAGTWNATCLYDETYSGNQDEWLISPSYNLSDGTTWFLDFWWNGSYYWSVDPYQNCELTVYISPDGGSNWLFLWDQLTVGAFDSYIWYNQQIDLTTYLSFTDVKFAFVYTGYDGAQFNVDAVEVNDAAPPPPPIGRCCSGVDFLTCDDLEQGDCDALGGHWSEGLNCTDHPCPVGPPNDYPEDAITITSPETVTGSTAAATIDCPDVLDWEAVWYRFDAPYAENDVDVNYCGTIGDIYTVGIVLYEEVLPLDCNAYIVASTYAFADCGDGYTNPNMQWSRLPGPATYLFPVYVDDGLKGGMDFSFDFTLVESPPLPPGGSCGDPFALTLGSGDMPYTTGVMTTCGMGNVYENSCLGYYDGGEDFIMELTILNDMSLIMNLTTDASYVGFYIADVCGDADPCIDYATSSGSSASMMGVPVTAGTYYIMVDTWPAPDCINGFVLGFDEFVASGGDDCSDPISVKLPDDMVAGVYTDVNYTCGRGNVYSETCLGSYDGGEDIIYELDVAGPLDVDITMTSNASWTGMLLADACGDVDPCIATSTGSGSDQAFYGLTLATGFYYIMIDTWPSPNCISEFTLTIQGAAGPQPGDDWELCVPVGDVVDLAFSTTTATPDGPGGCLTSPNIWYCYTATCDGLATISLCGSSYDTKMAVYDGTDPFVDPMMGCNDDFCGLQSELSVGVVAGNTYLVEVGGYGSSVGDGILNISCIYCPPPPNDICGAIGPVPLVGGTPLVITGDVSCATADCAALAADGYTWHGFTTTTTMDISVMYCGMSPAWGNGFIVMVGDCGCVDNSTWVYATDWDFTSCGDGNVTINWYAVPPGTWSYPVIKDFGSNPPDGLYTMEILGNALSQLSVSPTFVDFGVQPQGATGTEVVDLTASGGTSDIAYSISYTYGSKSMSSLNPTGLSMYAPEKPSDYPPYENPVGNKQGGEDISTAVVISSIPHASTGTIDGYVDDYEEVCPYSSTSPDVVYAYTPAADITVDISLCNPGTDYDTKLFLYENTYTPGAPFACNDDACPGYISALWELALTGGNTYYIVIDGYGGAVGNYDLTITEYEEPDPFECPPGALLEAEACGDDTNGGCNMASPAFEAVECGQITCGTSWADGGTRDTDWYEFVLYENTTVTLTGQANFGGYIIGFIDTADCALVSSIDPYVIATNAGDIVSVSKTIGPGTYWIFSGHTVYYDFPCGTLNDYWFEVDCPEGPVLWLSADPNPGTVPANSTVGLNVNYDATELEEGVYTASVDISHDGGKSTTVIPVAIEIGVGVDPFVVATPTSIDFGTVLEGDAGSDIVTLSNGGSGSITVALEVDYGLKDLTGSYMEAGSTYQPGLTMPLDLWAWNNSGDWEWAMFIDAIFPTGVTVNSATTFDNPYDPGIAYMGFGTYAPQMASWGDGGGYLDFGWSLATLDVSYDAGLSGDLTVDYGIWGDGYGDPPHEIYGSFLIPMFINPLTSWCTIDVTGGVLGAPIDVTVSFDATDLPGGVYTCDIAVTDDITRTVTNVPITLAVYEWDHVALDPDPVLALEQNATGPRAGFSYIGEMNALDGSHVIADVTGATVAGLAGTIGMGTHPLVQGNALEVEFDLKAFAASYGWPTGTEVHTYDVELTFSDMSTYTVTDEFEFAGHISGDVDLSGEINIGDLVYCVNYMFNGGPAPEVMATIDIDGNCTLGDIGDLIHLVNFMFNGGADPAYCPN